MLTGFFALLVVTALVLDYVFIERHSKKRPGSDLPLPGPIPLAEAMEPPPEGIFLQPGFTWTRLRRNGEIFLGLHPILDSLVGTDYTLELRPDDERVVKGEPILRIREGTRELRLFSPVDGEILEGNTDFRPIPGWKGTTIRGGSWVYRIQPAHRRREASRWLSGDKASAWNHQQYRRIRDFLSQREEHPEVGPAAADGGEIPAGILTTLGPQVWESFQQSILPCSEEVEGM